jgi:biopolymer transport protein ExbD
MRRFSQRHSLVTLSDINITPLLDLAFVLLIIFVITTPLLEQGLELNLPDGGRPDRTISREDTRVVEVHPRGFYVLANRTMPLEQLVALLVREAHANPNLVVRIRADELTPFRFVFQLTDALSQAGLTRINFASEVKRQP